MTIGELAAQAGLTASAIRFYEKAGLLTPPARIRGRRVYSSDALHQFTLIVFAKETGFTLDEIKLLLRGFPKSTPASERGEIFYSLKEAQILTERWRVEYNTERPHSALGYRPPAPPAILPKPGHGDVENKERFPHLHTPGGDYGQRSKQALH